MSSGTLGRLMRIAVITIAVCGIYLFGYIIPSLGKSIVYDNPEFSGWFWPWWIFAWLFALPCYAVLFLAWKVSGSVRQDKVFTALAAKWVKQGAELLLFDAALLLVGNVVLLFLEKNHPGMLLFSVVGSMFVVTLAIFAAVLSRYLTKAAVLQEESEGTL